MIILDKVLIKYCLIGLNIWLKSLWFKSCKVWNKCDPIISDSIYSGYKSKINWCELNHIFMSCCLILISTFPLNLCFHVWLLLFIFPHRVSEYFVVKTGEHKNIYIKFSLGVHFHQYKPWNFHNWNGGLMNWRIKCQM